MLSEKIENNTSKARISLFNKTSPLRASQIDLEVYPLKFAMKQGSMLQKPEFYEQCLSDGEVLLIKTSLKADHCEYVVFSQIISDDSIHCFDSSKSLGVFVGRPVELGRLLQVVKHTLNHKTYHLVQDAGIKDRLIMTTLTGEKSTQIVLGTCKVEEIQSDKYEVGMCTVKEEAKIQEHESTCMIASENQDPGLMLRFSVILHELGMCKEECKSNLVRVGQESKQGSPCDI